MNNNKQMVEINCFISNIPDVGHENQLITIDGEAAGAGWSPCIVLIERRLVKTEQDEE